MRKSLVFVALNILYICAHGHMCMINPYQRGGEVSDINMIEAPACDNSDYNQSLSPPCYKTNNAHSTETQYINNGLKQLLIQQKNHDHYNASNPGNFTFNLWEYVLATNRYRFIQTLGSVPDTPTNGSQALYQVLATIPTLNNGFSYVIQGVYYTNDWYDGIQYNFYQCADVIAE